MKRWASLIIGIIVQLSASAGVTVWAEDWTEWIPSAEGLEVGDYFILGSYDGEPIVWRYMDEDENGKLMVSDRVLCRKPFGNTEMIPYDSDNYNNFWKESFIRTWLNADVDEGEVDWSLYIWKEWIVGMNFQEKGFLHKSNFSPLERKVMKPVTQWTMLPEDRLDLSENGLHTAYTAIKEIIPGSPRDGGGNLEYNIPELPEVYSGAAYQVTDTVFLLDEMQIYHMWENFGDVAAQARNSFQSDWEDPWKYYDGYDSYFLRTPTSRYTTEVAATLVGRSDYDLIGDTVDGIRPAFYLDEEQTMRLSGSGTLKDPYIISGKGIRVSLNGKDLQLDQPGTIKDGIVLVPLRSIFEELGATINWDEASQTVTAVKDKDKIQMQIGSSILSKNGTETDLGYPAVLEGERTMVPLNAIEVGFGSIVDWNGDTLQVTITN